MKASLCDSIKYLPFILGKNQVLGKAIKAVSLLLPDMAEFGINAQK